MTKAQRKAQLDKWVAKHKVPRLKSDQGKCQVDLFNRNAVNEDTKGYVAYRKKK